MFSRQSSPRLRGAQLLADALPVLVRKGAKDLAEGIPVRLADIGPLAFIHERQEEHGDVLGRLVGDDPIAARLALASEPDLTRPTRAGNDVPN